MLSVDRVYVFFPKHQGDMRYHLDPIKFYLFFQLTEAVVCMNQLYELQIKFWATERK